MAFAYLISQLRERILIFLERWYREASIHYWNWVIEEFRQLDRTFALKINLRLLFQPLYGDYTLVGRILGPFFRFFRILFGLGIYLVFFSLALIFWFIWLGTIPYLLFQTLF